jgi:hypothetical protein
VRRRDINLILPFQPVHLNAPCHRIPIGIGQCRQASRAIGERSPRSLIRQQEHHGRARHRLPVFIGHLDHRFSGHPLSYIVDGALAFYNRDIQLLDLWSSLIAISNGLR